MAGEKIKLLELDIDVEQLTKKAASSQKSIEFLKEEVKFFQNVVKEGDKIIERSKERLVELEKQNKKDSEEYQKLSQSLDSFTKKQEDNRQKLELVGSELRKNQKEYSATKRQLDVYNKTIETELGIITKTDGSINQLNQAVANNRKAYRDLTKEQRENEEVGGRLLKLINEQDKEYKDLQKSIGTTQVEVGNYKEQIKEALAESSAFSTQMDAQIAQIPVVGGALSVTTKYLRGYAQGQIASAKATTGGTKALKLFRAALISTGIGAILVLLASLISYLTSTQEGIDKVNRVLTPLKDVFQALIGILQEVGKFLFDAFSNPKQTITELYNFVKGQLTRQFQAFGKILQGLVTLDFGLMKEGFRDIGEQARENLNAIGGYFQEVGDRISESIDRGREIQRLQEDIERGEIKLVNLQSKIKDEIVELAKIRQDTTKSSAEREAAVQRELELTQQLSDAETGILDLRIQQMKLKQEANDTTRADELELARLEAERADKARSRDELEATRTRRRKSALNEYNKAIDADIKESRTRLQLYIAENDKINSTLEKRVELYEEALSREELILKKKLNARKITHEEYELSLLKVRRDYAKLASDAGIANLQHELDLYIAQNRSKIDNDRALTNDIVAEEQHRLQQVYDRRLAILEEQRDNELISDEDFNLQKLILTSEFLEQQDELEKQFREHRREAEQIDYENELETRRLRGENEFLLRQEELERRRQAEIEIAEKTGADISKIEEKYAELRKTLDEEVQTARVATAQAAIGDIRELFAEESKIGKAAAIAQALINTYQGITAGLKLGWPLSVPAVAFASATGFKAVSDITKTKTPKAAKGIAIDIGGKRHGSGGTKFYGEDGTAFEAEEGEKMFVLSRRASAALGPLLSDVNQQYGGVALSNRSSYLAAGGQVIRNATRTIQKDAQINYDLLADKIGARVGEANTQLPSPVVAVEDINYGQSNYAQVVNGANL